MLKNINKNPKFTKLLISKNIFKKNPLVVADVGAASGFEKHWDVFKDQMIRVGFEPNEESFKKLKNTKNCQYYNIALGKEAKKAPFYVTKFRYASSAFKVNEAFMSRFSNFPYHQTKSVETIETVSLDTFCENNVMPQIDFMKMDTEGTELEILQGAKNMLKGVLGLDIEIAFQQYHADRPVFRDVDTYLHKHNFSIYDLDCYRHARKSLPNLKKAIVYPSDHGQILWAQGLYMKDMIGNRNNANIVSKGRILKAICLFELFCHPDSAIELFQWALKHHIIEFVDDAVIDLLIPDEYSGMSLQEYMQRFSKVKQFKV